MSTYRGSEWNKWDLHVHPPGTKLNDAYGNAEDVIDKFCDFIENSDVQVIGLTDYFSVENYYEITDKFYEKFPDSNKVFFPNIELRLNESVNDNLEEVNTHIIFSPNLEKTQAINFLAHLPTTITDGNDRNKMCSELTGEDFKTATVTREDIDKAIKTTFGKKIDEIDYRIIVTAANNDGIRPKRGKKRKENITDQIDKLSDAFFGGSQNSNHFLNIDRFEDKSQKSKQKPVFSGSDAHSFEDLKNKLGKESDDDAKSEVTWVKANPTYEGLIQTLIEPKERVKIQSLRPDQKEPYKIICSVKFRSDNVFPEQINLNPNLVSIIGSRSTGKSALLAYIAYAIDPEDTIEKQMAANEIPESATGPAAGKTWNDVSDIECDIKWCSGDNSDGRVIYIPQNYLFSISKRPSEINKKIVPVLFKKYLDIKNQHQKSESEISNANQIIRESTQSWFANKESIGNLKTSIKNIGSKQSIKNTRDDYKKKIDVLKKKFSISQAELDKYREITEQISEKKAEIENIDSEIESMQQFIDSGNGNSVININPSVSFYPDITDLPEVLSSSISKLVEESKDQLTSKISVKVKAYYVNQLKKRGEIKKKIKKIIDENKVIIDKNRKNAELDKLINDFNKQNKLIKDIDDREKLIEEKNKSNSLLIEKINSAIHSRSQAYLSLSQIFSTVSQDQTDVRFGVEIEFDQETLESLSEKYNRNVSSPYLTNQSVDLEKIQGEIKSYLEYLVDTQKLNSSFGKKETGIATLTTSKSIRYNATLDGDKIGGFKPSTMTPGKQALFALTLILDESDDAWPLLIDQPEDDLDSRSIYDYIVPYLIERKKERQILMVSHNANLVIGSDSEQILVANRHGVDSKNRNSQIFDYLGGAIEDTSERTDADYTLESCGIREHSIDILDGGEEAFEKRKNKYKI